MVKTSPQQCRPVAWFGAPILAFSLALSSCGSSNDESTPSDDDPIPATAAEPTLTFHAAKTFRFNWSDVPDANFYRLLENQDGVSGFTQLGFDVPQGTQRIDHIVPLYARTNAQYILQSCTDSGCMDSDVLAVSGTLENSIGSVRIDNTNEGNSFSRTVSLSADGATLAVGAFTEKYRRADSPVWSGSVYVFIRSGSEWIQQARLEASNTDVPVWEGDEFGGSVSLSANGNTLAVGARKEDSNATGVNGDQSDNSADQAGAAYVFVRSGGEWSQQAYIKASNTDRHDWFGGSVSLSADGNTLAVGARFEDSKSTGVNGDQSDNSAGESGATYVFTRSGSNWSQQAFIKASNTHASTFFGSSVSLSADGNMLAAGSSQELSNATGINGNQFDTSYGAAGAVYVYARTNGIWSQQAYIKASNTSSLGHFGKSVSLSADGNTLAVNARFDADFNRDQSDNSAGESGAAYVFTRSSSEWSQQAYVKASNTDDYERLGDSISLSADGNMLAVGAPGDDSSATGVNGDQSDNSFFNSGAVYVFTRVAGEWNQLAFVKAKNTYSNDNFGSSVSLAGDGAILAVRASGGSSRLIGDQIDNTTDDFSDVVYLY